MGILGKLLKNEIFSLSTLVLATMFLLDNGAPVNKAQFSEVETGIKQTVKSLPFDRIERQIRQTATSFNAKIKPVNLGNSAFRTGFRNSGSGNYAINHGPIFIHEL